MRELSECTHKPVIHGRPMNLKNVDKRKKSKGNSRERRNLRSYSCDSKEQRIPSINPVSNKICSNSTFFQRQKHFTQLYSKNKQLLISFSLKFRMKKHAQFDSETHFPLFQPKINNSFLPNKSRMRRSKTVFDSLYDDGASRRLRAVLSNGSNEIESNNQGKIINATSEAIVELLEKERIKEIFDCIPKNKELVIEPSDIDFDQMNPEILELFWPLFLEIVERRLSVNFDQFYYASLKLRSKWSILQKDFIRRRGKKARSFIDKN